MSDVFSSLDALREQPVARDSGDELASLHEQLSRLEHLPRAELDALDQRAQALFHDLLLRSEHGAERDVCFRAAYAVVPAVLCERRRRNGQSVEGFGIGKLSVARVLALLGKQPQRVLDIGCSSGTLVQALLEAGHDARGVELSRQLVDMGTQRLERAGFTGQRLIHGDFLRLSAAELRSLAQVDLIWSNDVLEHLHPSDVPEFLGRCRSLLRQGGTLWLITPSGLTQTTRKTLHLRQYFLAELLEQGKRSGFTQFSGRLLGTARRQAWPMNQPSRAFVPIKLAVEPLLKRLPRKVRVPVAKAMAYSELFLR